MTDHPTPNPSTHPEGDHDRTSEDVTLDATALPTPPSSSPPSASDPKRTTGSTTTPTARFTPGDLVADRYRVVAFLGKGGMGEVYRADDLELAQSVAIKILPARVAADPNLAERVRAEVRLARGITHRNVCRIHDIARLPENQGGDLFITMEYVDGEDLSTLLRRIGKLPQDKAIDVARQLCAALAAAHDQGVIHRDLKPANVMLDGRGNARLTDFGIAAIDDTLDQRDASSGTPAYMSPEQFKGEGVSKKSDIYSLGLVIYELLTGRPAWKADSLAQLRTMRETTGSPVSLTSVSRSEIDPALAALVERCTETNPDDRPASALAVAAALPGADPLAAAIAAGETPSPELIAASGGRGVLRPAIAATYALLAVALAAAAILISSPFTLLHHAGPPPAPAVMQDTAEDMIRQLGHTIDPDIPSHGAWYLSGSNVSRVASAVKAAHEEGNTADWSALREGINTPVWYWLRYEPGGFHPRVPDNRIWTDYPLRDAPGSMIIQLDQNRKLREFTVIPPKYDTEPDDSEPDWSVAFDLAGLDFDQFTPIDARANPGNDPLIRRAWTGPAPRGRKPDSIDGEPTELNVYLGASGGKITDLTITRRTSTTPSPANSSAEAQTESESESETPNATTSSDSPNPDTATPTDPPTTEPQTPTSPQAAALIQSIVQWVLVGTITLVAGILAYRNIRLRRGDARRAMRLAVTLFLMGAAASVLEADSAPLSLPKLIGPYPTWSASIGFSLMAAACYIAAEPLARSRWPGSLVSWTRLFSGQFKDPMIGRDTLIGICAGSTLFFVAALSPHINTALGEPPQGPGQEMYFLLTTLKGVRYVLALVISQIGQSLLNAAAIALLVLLATLLFNLARIRQRWPALILITLLIIGQQLGQPGHSIADRALAAIANLAVLIILARLGLFAAAATLATMSLLTIASASTPLGDWWTPAAITPLVVLTIALGLAYRTATAGQSLFGTNSQFTTDRRA